MSLRGPKGRSNPGGIIMDNEVFQQLVLEKLEILTRGQKRLEDRVANLEAGQKKLEKGQKQIRKELRFVWDDIKKLDNRIAKLEETNV